MPSNTAHVNHDLATNTFITRISVMQHIISIKTVPQRDGFNLQDVQGCHLRIFSRHCCWESTGLCCWDSFWLNSLLMSGLLSWFLCLVLFTDTCTFKTLWFIPMPWKVIQCHYDTSVSLLTQLHESLYSSWGRFWWSFQLFCHLWYLCLVLVFAFTDPFHLGFYIFQ